MRTKLSFIKSHFISSEQANLSSPFIRNRAEEQEHDGEEKHSEAEV